MRKQKSNKLRIIHLLLLAALLLLTAKLIYAQVRGGDSMGRIEWTSMQLYRNGSNYDYSYNYALRLDTKSGKMTAALRLRQISMTKSGAVSWRACL